MEVESFTSAGIVADTRRGLQADPKWLSSLYFYDERGSELFERICQTPEYYPTRTEAAILEEHSDAMLEAAGNDLLVAELGSGSSVKTRILLDCLLKRQGPSTYVPVDVSGDFLATVAQQLEQEHPGLHVEPVAAEYVAGLEQIGKMEAPRRLVLFLGSSLGNFEPDEQAGLLAKAYQSLQPGDAFLLGTDLIKDADVLNAAYNDAAGVTAAFNRNLLRHVARRLGGEDPSERFDHVAFWNEDKHRIEMHLEAREDVHLVLPDANLDLHVAKGERIHTENSYKFTVEGIQEMAAGSGWQVERTWTDSQQWFGLTLLRR